MIPQSTIVSAPVPVVRSTLGLVLPPIEEEPDKRFQSWMDPEMVLEVYPLASFDSKSTSTNGSVEANTNQEMGQEN